MPPLSPRSKQGRVQTPRAFWSDRATHGELTGDFQSPVVQHSPDHVGAIQRPLRPIIHFDGVEPDELPGADPGNRTDSSGKFDCAVGGGSRIRRTVEDRAGLDDKSIVYRTSAEQDTLPAAGDRARIRDRAGATYLDADAEAYDHTPVDRTAFAIRDVATSVEGKSQ